MLILYCVIVLIVGYLLGSLNGALIVSKLLLNEDVRSKGSGNAGLTNFLRSYGGAKTFLVLGIDIFKCVIAVLPAWYLLSPLGFGVEGKMLAGCAVLLGHVFPLYFGFKGGKGILTTGTFVLLLSVKAFILVMLAFLILVIITRRVSVGSIAAAALFPLGCYLDFGLDIIITPLSLFIAVLIICKHIPNIKRLIKGDEPKLSFGRKKEN